MLRFKKKIKIADVGITAIAGILSVCVMYYAVYKFGMQEAGEELILNMFYLACLVMIGLYFFNRMDTNQFNYRCTLCVGMTILLRFFKALTQEQTARVLGVSQVQVSRLERRALQKLRMAMETEG